MIVTILIFTAVLSLLVLVHELGHFLTARRAGVLVEEFGFGFPPRIFGVKRGSAVYSLNWIPLGGFVRIKGEMGEHAHDRDSYASKKPGQKAVILVAGVVMNLALAWALLSFGYLIGLPQVIDEIPVSARVADVQVRIASVLQGSPADKGGLQTGDAIVSLDGSPVTDIENFRSYTGSHAGTAVIVGVVRDGKTFSSSVTPVELAETKRPGIGIALMRTGLVSYPFWLAPVRGAEATWSFASEIVTTFAGFFRDLFLRRPIGVEFSGPVGIAVVTGEVAKLGFRYLLQFAALLSVNLAVVNILPFPALDGGRLFFLALEKLRGRSLNRNFEALAHNLGFALLILLVLVVTYRDVVRFGGGFFSNLLGS